MLRLTAASAITPARNIARRSLRTWRSEIRSWIAERASTKRRLRNLIDASGLLGELIAIAPRAARDEELRSLHACDYVDRVRADSADRGGDAGGWSPFGRWTYEIAALAAGGCLADVGAVFDQTVANAYALVRPPVQLDICFAPAIA